MNKLDIQLVSNLKQLVEPLASYLSAVDDPLLALLVVLRLLADEVLDIDAVAHDHLRSRNVIAR